MVLRHASASAKGSVSTMSAGRTRLWATKLRRRRGRPRRALWICRCAWTTLARRPQPHRANHSKTWYKSDGQRERSSPYEHVPVVLSLGSTALGAPLYDLANVSTGLRMLLCHLYAS